MSNSRNVMFPGDKMCKDCGVERAQRPGDRGDTSRCFSCDLENRDEMERKEAEELRNPKRRGF